MVRVGVKEWVAATWVWVHLEVIPAGAPWTDPATECDKGVCFPYLISAQWQISNRWGFSCAFCHLPICSFCPLPLCLAGVEWASVGGREWPDRSSGGSQRAWESMWRQDDWSALCLRHDHCGWGQCLEAWLCPFGVSYQGLHYVRGLGWSAARDPLRGREWTSGCLWALCPEGKRYVCAQSFVRVYAGSIAEKV